MTALVVLVTAPKDGSARIAKELLDSKVAACVNVIPGVRSSYWWEGKVEEAEEDLLIIKTTEEAYGRLEELIRRVHPYKAPEVLALRVDRGLPEYLSWLEGSVSPRGQQAKA
ncbi:divalent-cation tolerance protein CutA [Acidilobus sp.]|uniref:divalent-cation tolerance protein CutA n=1 Tax=Acidilobus sp. TaxID=1872109 RepID=UPI003D06FD9E